MNDPLSAVLAILHARSELSAGLRAGGAWSVAVAPYTGLKFNALVRGAAWITVDGAPAVRLRAGDCFLLAGGHAFTVASDPAVTPQAAHDVFAGAVDGVVTVGEGSDVEIVAGRMALAPAFASLLTASLPPLTVIAAGLNQAGTVQWLLQRLHHEATHDAPGGAVMTSRLMEMLFVELMRAALQERTGATGWLAALADPRLGRALHALHADPGHTWTVAGLAEAAYMSRSGFAATFRQIVGIPPLAYLTRLRLQQASHALHHDGATVAAAAAVAGFASESAFGTAFRRVFGCSPGRYAAQSTK